MLFVSLHLGVERGNLKVFSVKFSPTCHLFHLSNIQLSSFCFSSPISPHSASFWGCPSSYSLSGPIPSLIGAVLLWKGRGSQYARRMSRWSCLLHLLFLLNFSKHVYLPRPWIHSGPRKDATGCPAQEFVRPEISWLCEIGSRFWNLQNCIHPKRPNVRVCDWSHSCRRKENETIPVVRYVCFWLISPWLSLLIYA